MLVVLFMGSACSTAKYTNFSTGGHVINLLTICVGFQWSLLCRGFAVMILCSTDEIRLGVHDVTESLMASFSLLIGSSFVLGRTAPLNSLVVALVHPPLYTVCRIVNEELLVVTDPGCGMPIHLFGALFGWSVHAVLLRARRNTIIETSAGAAPLASTSPSPQTPTSTVLSQAVERYHHNDRKCSSRDVHADGISYLGSVIILIGCSTLNGLVTESDAEMCRVVVNTLLAQTSSVAASLGLVIGTAHVNGSAMNFSILLGSLVSGGVSVSCVAQLMLQPSGAVMIGCVTGLLTTLFFQFAEPRLQRRLLLPSPSGALSFHGMAALISGLAAIVAAMVSAESGGIVDYYNSLYPIYPARVPQTETAGRALIISTYPFLEEKARGRTAEQQAAFQALGLALCVGLALLGGMLTGFLTRLSSERCGNRFPREIWRDESFLLNRRRRTSEDNQQTDGDYYLQEILCPLEGEEKSLRKERRIRQPVPGILCANPFV